MGEREREREPTRREVRALADEAFGFERLRPGQERAIRAVLAGRDTLAVMPTGAGKSAIYQVAGLFLDGPTIVVSPLIALQQDQEQGLDELGATLRDRLTHAAASLNSTLTRAEREEVLERYEAGEIEYLFLAPEQLAGGDALERLRAHPPSLLVVDEAHCVSEWGHDFRPDYLRLGAAAEALGRPVLLALTATAAPPVREEIEERLGLRDPERIVQGFDRPNIRLAVEPCGSDAAKRERLVELVRSHRSPGIVYAGTRRNADELAELLRQHDVGAAAYHAGIRNGERERVQEEFMTGRTPVVVATSAFGMGVDKPDVGFVFHFDVPASLDAYYQQIGRAGREGQEALAVLLYRPEDLWLQRFLTGGGGADADAFEQITEALEGAGEAGVEPEALREETGLSAARLRAALNRLEEVGAVELGDGPDGVRPAEGGPDPEEAVRAASELQERQQAVERSRLEMMRGYAEARSCRRAYLLNYFGEAYEPPCGNCDNCLAGAGEQEAAPEGPFALGERVRHERFGAGRVVRHEPGKVIVLFDEYGYQALALDLVLERGLLEREA